MRYAPARFHVSLLGLEYAQSLLVGKVNSPGIVSIHVVQHALQPLGNGHRLRLGVVLVLHIIQRCARFPRAVFFFHGPVFVSLHIIQR